MLIANMLLALPCMSVHIHQKTMHVLARIQHATQYSPKQANLSHLNNLWLYILIKVGSSWAVQVGGMGCVRDHGKEGI